MIGEVWEEIARPGHTVEVIRLEESRYLVKGAHIPMVVYKHIGAHSKRAQAFPSVTEEKLFRKRYRKLS